MAVKREIVQVLRSAGAGDISSPASAAPKRLYSYSQAPVRLQGYLAHKKLPLPRTLHQAYT